MDDDIFADAFSASEDEGATESAPAPEPVAPEPVAEPKPDVAEPVAEPEPVAPAAAVQPEPQAHIPLSAHLAEREKRQEAERERDRLRAQLAPQQAPQVPDPVYETEEYIAHQQQQLQAALLDQTLNVSERFARKEHGVETVESAKQWALNRFNTDPHYRARVLADPDPYELVVTEWKRDQVFTQLQPGQLDAFLAWQSGQIQPTAAQTIPVQPAVAPAAAVLQQPAARPPMSLAGAPSAGGLGIIADEDPFAAEFKRKG